MDLDQRERIAHYGLRVAVARIAALGLIMRIARFLCKTF